MSIVGWVTITTIFWLVGFMVTRYGASAPLPPNVLLIKPPRWLYYLCGAPQAPGFPRGVIRLGSFLLQLSGLLMGTYALILDKQWPVTNPHLSVLIGIPASFILGGLIACLIYWIYRYIP